MKSVLAVTLRTAGLVALGSWFSIGAALAQTEGNGGNAQQINVPTLGGFGLAALAGALSVGGAWLLSRGRDKQK